MDVTCPNTKQAPFRAGDTWHTPPSVVIVVVLRDEDVVLLQQGREALADLSPDVQEGHHYESNPDQTERSLLSRRRTSQHRNSHISSRQAGSCVLKDCGRVVSSPGSSRGAPPLLSRIPTAAALKNTTHLLGFGQNGAGRGAHGGPARCDGPSRPEHGGLLAGAVVSEGWEPGQASEGRRHVDNVWRSANAEKQQYYGLEASTAPPCATVTQHPL